MAKKQVKHHGGAREGAGRPATLKDVIRRSIQFEPKHLRKLERYAKRNDLRGYSDAVRHLIDSHA